MDSLFKIMHQNSKAIEPITQVTTMAIGTVIGSLTKYSNSLPSNLAKLRVELGRYCGRCFMLFWKAGKSALTPPTPSEMRYLDVYVYVFFIIAIYLRIMGLFNAIILSKFI